MIDKGRITEIKIQKGHATKDAHGYTYKSSPTVTIKTEGLGQWDAATKFDGSTASTFPKQAACWKEWFPVAAEMSKLDSATIVDAFLVVNELSKYDEQIKSELVAFQYGSDNALKVSKGDMMMSATKLSLEMSYNGCVDSIEGSDLLEAARYESTEL